MHILFPIHMDGPPLACYNFTSVNALATITMPKEPRSRVHRAERTLYHRHDKPPEFSPLQHRDCLRASRSSDGDYNGSLQPLLIRGDPMHRADTESLHTVGPCETPRGDLLAKSSTVEGLLAISKSSERFSTPKAAIQEFCDTLNPISPLPKQEFAAPDRFNHSIFAGASPNAKLEQFEFEFENVVQVEGDQCQIRWADSVIRDSDLRRRHLHGKPLLEYMVHAIPLGSGLSKVIWKLTWEPVDDILQFYTDVVQRESHFEFAYVIQEQGEECFVQWDNAVVHTTTLETLCGPLLSCVESILYPRGALKHGHCVIKWKPRWVSARVMEAYIGDD
jgi:hypothetical protein